MKFGPIPTTIAVVLLLWMILPSFEVSVGSYSVYLDTVFAFFIGGLAGGFRFVYLKSRAMSVQETAFHAFFSYVVATAIPLALFSGIVYLVKDYPEVAELLDKTTPATDVVGFLVGYFAVDAVPSVIALFAALSAPRLQSV
ncbi:MAG: hypothetical protein AAF667_12530 [Pseudomonadota bacterium]